MCCKFPQNSPQCTKVNVTFKNFLEGVPPPKLPYKGLAPSVVTLQAYIFEPGNYSCSGHIPSLKASDAHV